MRLNNLSARLLVNAWLVRTGRAPLDAGLSYLQFATALRKVTAAKQAPASFVSRPDAVAYVRHIAQSMAGAP